MTLVCGASPEGSLQHVGVANAWPVLAYLRPIVALTCETQ
jgi:hypothetical protein